MWYRRLRVQFPSIAPFSTTWLAIGAHWRLKRYVLSQRTRYAIRALLHLADRHGEGPVQLTEIAEAQNIPSKFLTVILS